MLDEKDLILKFKEGNNGAFEVLVRMYYRSAYNFAFRFVGDHSAADDVVQESFVKAHRAIASFRGDASFKSWLFRIVRNSALNLIRFNSKRDNVSIDDVMVGEIHHAYGNMERAQTNAVLAKAIAELPARQKLALELRIFEDLPFKEIADIMESPLDTAKANYRHAVLGLVKILKKTDGGRAMEEARRAFEGLSEDES